MPSEEEWVIWNGAHGLVTTATMGRIEARDGGRMAWLDEPFEMVGPFDVEELEANGRIAFAACIVMSRHRWREDQVELRRESLKIRRATEERINERFTRSSGGRGGHQGKYRFPEERQHREALNLPVEGKLEVRQINTAFRRLAQKAHPDAGGTNEQFVRIATARDILLERVS